MAVRLRRFAAKSEGPGSCADGGRLRVAVRCAGCAAVGVLGLLLVYRVGWGKYARFLKYKSPVLTGVLVVLGG